MKEMELHKRLVDRVVVLDIKGEVDIYSGEELKRRLDEHIPAAVHLLLNISEIDYIDSFGLSLLIAVKKRMSKERKRFGMCCPQSYVRRILNLTKLYDYLSVYENEEKAINAFGAEAGQEDGELEPKLSISSDERRA